MAATPSAAQRRPLQRVCTRPGADATPKASASGSDSLKPLVSVGRSLARLATPVHADRRETHVDRVAVSSRNDGGGVEIAPGAETAKILQNALRVFE